MSKSYVYKVWDKKHKAYTVNQGRISNNKHHPGRVYTHASDVVKCLELCDSFFGDVVYKEVHVFVLKNHKWYEASDFLDKGGHI